MKLQKQIACCFLFLILTLVFLPFVAAVTYNRVFPSNTVLAEDFDGSTLNGWYSLDLCAPNSYGALNTTHAFSGPSSLGVQCANANTARDLRRTIGYFGDYIGVSVWRSYSDVCRTTGGSGGPFMSLELDDPKDASNSFHWEAHLAYYCNAKVWQILDSTGAAKTISADLSCSYNCALNTRGQEDWMYSKIIARRSTHQYVQIITPLGVYDCNAIRAITTNGDCTMNSFSNAGKLDQTNWEIELGWQTFALAGSCACNGFFDNLLVTDETPGGSGNPVAFAILNAAWILATLIPVAGLVTWTGVNRTETGKEWTPKQKFMAVFGVTLMVTVLAVLGIVLLSLHA